MGITIWLEADIDVGNKEIDTIEIGENFNVTHNLVPMWHKAGCYRALYKCDGKLALEIVPALKKSLNKMLKNPIDFKKLNPQNGWGSYEGAIDFLYGLIKEFSKYPKARIKVSA